MSGGYVPLTAAGHDIPTHFSLLGPAPNLRQEAFHSMASPPHGPAALPITYKQSPHKPVTSGKTRARTHWKRLHSGRNRKLALSGPCSWSWPSSSICPRLLIPQARAGPSPFAAGCRVLHLGDSVLRPLLLT